MKLPRNRNCTKHRGFTLLELLLVLLILGLVTGAVFSQMGSAQQRMSTEQVKLDDFQEARDFVDQFFRDINQIGDPNIRVLDTTADGLNTWTPPLAVPLINDSRIAIGLVRIDSNELRFEGSVNGAGTVQSLVYMMNGSGTCPLCFQRSQADKVPADPLNGQNQNWGTEVNDVVSNVIFTYFRADGTQVTILPVDISTAAGAQTIASIKTIHISLTIRNPSVMDPKTNQPIETNFEGEVSLNNCSMAAAGQAMSCN